MLQYPLFLRSLKISPPLIWQFCSHFRTASAVLFAYCHFLRTTSGSWDIHVSHFSFYYCIVSSTDKPGSYTCLMKREFMYLFNDCCSSNPVTLLLVTQFVPQSTTNSNNSWRLSVCRISVPLRNYATSSSHIHHPHFNTHCWIYRTMNTFLYTAVTNNVFELSMCVCQTTLPFIGLTLLFCDHNNSRLAICPAAWS